MKKANSTLSWLIPLNLFIILSMACGLTIGSSSPPVTIAPTDTATAIPNTPTTQPPTATATLPPPTDTPVPSGTPTSAPTATPSKIPVASYECTDSIGCVKLEPGDPIHIAYLLVVEGINAPLGIDSRNGVELAIDDAGGNILGHPIKFDGENGGCTASGGRAAARQLASDPSILGIIGPSCSSETRAAEPLLSAAGFVTISPSNTAPDLTDPTNPNHYPGYYRTAHNDTFQGAAAADYAYIVLGARTAATIQDGSLYADRLQQIFADRFTEMGGRITSQIGITPGIEDMGSVLTSIGNDRPDFLYFPIFLPEGQYLIEQAKTTSGLENTKLMGADGLYTPDLVDGAGAAVEGFMVSSPVVEGTAYDQFVGKYLAKFNTYPINIFHAHAYDAFNILKAAIEDVAVVLEDGTVYIPRQALRDAVASTIDFPGLTGLLTCSPDGDCANPVIGVYEYHAGDYPPDLIWKE